MKAYVITTGALFGLIFVVHIWRATIEGIALAREPFFVLLTGAAAALSLWAWRVYRALPKSQ